MEYKFTFNTEKEKEQLIKDNSNLTLIKIAYHLGEGEKYLIFTDKETIYELTETEILENKISILEAENKSLKEGIIEFLSTNDSTKLIKLISED